MHVYKSKESTYLRRRDASFLKIPLKVAAHGRRMVTIVDPHIKRDSNYAVHKEATSRGLYIKDKDGNVSRPD